MSKPRRPLSLLVLVAAVLSLLVAGVATNQQVSQLPESAGPAPDPAVLGSAQNRTQPLQSVTAAPAAAVVGPQTFAVASLAEWTAAVAAVEPGDTIRLTTTINSPLQYRGNGQGDGVALSGTAAEPITITADPGVWIDPGNPGNGKVGLDILFANHINVVGVNIRNTQFGLRFIQVSGTQSAPVRVTGNTITLTGHSGLIVQGNINNGVWSNDILLEGNKIFDTGQSGARYGEGIYIGYGSAEWVDETNNITIRGNEIYRTTAEGIDIKPGTKGILVDSNLIHDLAPLDGGAISAHYTGGTPNPAVGDLDQVWIVNNRIWNQNLNGTGGSNDWAIWVGHGGVEIIGNRIWGFRNNGSATRAVRIRGVSDFGPFPIVIKDNIFWTAQGWIAEGNPSGAGLVQASGNIGAVAAGGTTVVDASYFPGNVPALGVGGTADSGSGPGSAFGSAPTSTAPAQSAPTETVAPTETAVPAETAAPAATAAPAQAAPAKSSTTTKQAASKSSAAAPAALQRSNSTVEGAADASTKATILDSAAAQSGLAASTTSAPEESDPDSSAELNADDAPAALAFVTGPAETQRQSQSPAVRLLGTGIFIALAAAGAFLLRVKLRPRI